jgi:nitroreductase
LTEPSRPGPAAGNGGCAETTLERLARLLDDRSSCRGFLPTLVQRPLIERVLATAQCTASWCNSQPWQVIVTSGEATETFRKALYAHASRALEGQPDFEFPREYRGVYLDRRRAAGLELYKAVGVQRDDDAGRRRQSLENFRFFGAPHVALVSTDAALGLYGAVDCGGYIANFLLAAHAAGLACVAQAALAFHSPFVRSHFDLNEDRRLVCGIAFGYADLDHPANRVRTDRAPIAEVVAWKT